MSAKVETTSAVEISSTKMSGTTASSVTPSSSQKVSKFAAKSGFVIPKNKLSGSLVPIFRVKKLESGDAADEESVKVVQRKTKWGPDLTQDAAVKRGRALAYQVLLEFLFQVMFCHLSSNVSFIFKFFIQIFYYSPSSSHIVLEF